MPTRMTGQRSRAETEAKLDLSEVRYCAAEGKAGLVWAAGRGAVIVTHGS